MALNAFDRHINFHLSDCVGARTERQSGFAAEQPAEKAFALRNELKQ
jgi:hypothetical protein